MQSLCNAGINASHMRARPFSKSWSVWPTILREAGAGSEPREAQVPVSGHAQVGKQTMAWRRDHSAGDSVAVAVCSVKAVVRIAYLSCRPSIQALGRPVAIVSWFIRPRSRKSCRSWHGGQRGSFVRMVIGQLPRSELPSWSRIDQTRAGAHEQQRAQRLKRRSHTQHTYRWKPLPCWPSPGRRIEPNPVERYHWLRLELEIHQCNAKVPLRLPIVASCCRNLLLWIIALVTWPVLRPRQVDVAFLPGVNKVGLPRKPLIRLQTER